MKTLIFYIIAIIGGLILGISLDLPTLSIIMLPVGFV